MKKPYAQARLYFRFVVSLIAWIYWLVRMVVSLLGGNRRNDAIKSASMWAVLDCCVVETLLFCGFDFFVLIVVPNV